MIPTKVVWPKAIERPKTLWLKAGLREMGVSVVESKRWIDKLRPPKNSRGPIVYPIEFVFGEKRILALYDINTIPKTIHRRFVSPGRVYFKIHLLPEHIKQGIIPAPNSASSLAFLGILQSLRAERKRREYYYDFQFIGWHDDDGMRIKTIRKSRAMKDMKQLTGLLPFKHHTKVPKELLPPRGKRMPYESHLRSQARSKVCLALPGGRALPYVSFRHVELWGMGTTVMSRKPTCRLFGIKNPNEIMIVYELKNFEEKLRYYLEHEDEREAIAERGLRYYEENLTPVNHAEYFCKTLYRKVMT